MSIYRPDYRNTSVIIKRFGAITEDYSAVEWIGINGTYLRGISGTSHVSFAPESTILIKCEIAPDASGPITGGLGGLRISVSSGTISWYNVTNGWVADRTVGSGTHILGWMRYNGATYPYYDGIITDVSGETTPPRRRVYFGCNSQNNTAGNADSSDILSSSSATYAIKIYEVAGALAYNNEVVTPAHMYAALWGSTYRLFEARMGRGSDTVLTPHSSSASGGGSAVTYGVQLHDLKYAFSSPYKDLMAIVCQDGGNPEAWADPVDKITNGTTTHNMAFRMAGGSGSSVSAAMPLPENYYVSRSGTYTFTDQEKGELIYGRCPKWNIWNDKLKFGLFVDMKDANTYVMRFNIFKDFNGNIMTPSGGSLSDARFDLIRFDGYNHHSNDAHAPILTSPSNITVFEHNTVQCLCNSESIMGGVIGGSMPDSSHPTVTERYCVFFKRDSALGAVGYRAGNLIPWNYAASELTEKIYGVTAKAAFADGTVIFDSDTKQNTPLDKNTASNIKQLYQESIVVEDFSLRPGFAGYIYKNKNASADNRKLNVNVALLFSTASSSPSSLKQIDCSRFIPSKTCSFEVKEDGNDSLTAWASTSEKYRLVVETDEQIGVLIGDYYRGTKLNMVDTFEPTNAYNQSSGLVLGIAPVNSNHTIEEQGYTYMFAVTIFTYFGNKYHVYNIVDESLTFSELETCYSGSSQPYNDPNLAVKYYGEALSGNSDKHIQSGDVSTRNNITASQFKTYGRFFAIYDHEIDPLTVGANHISDQTTVVVNIANKINAPIYCALQGEWNTDTQTIVDLHDSKAVQSPYYLSKLPYSGDYVYEDLYMFYDVSGSTYTPRSTMPSMFEAQLFKNGEFVAGFNEEVLEDNGYTLSISWQEASRYEGFMLFLNGGMANGGLFVANVAFSGTKSRGDYYTLKFTSIS